jgi:hypothetical protein
VSPGDSSPHTGLWRLGTGLRPSRLLAEGYPRQLRQLLQRHLAFLLSLAIGYSYAGKQKK